MREAKMNAADKKKDKLIAEYRSKKKLTNNDKDYLLAEGIIVNDDGSMSKTEDKLLTLNWHDINPANINAFEWGTKFIKQCRDDPESYLSEQ
jgi:ribosome biogenesis protein Tsr3